MKWATKITKVKPNHLVTRGYRQEDLIGNIPYSHVIYLLLKGELPSKEHGKMINKLNKENEELEERLQMSYSKFIEPFTL